ncbi:hypothetical protein OFAG_02262 [Oxalobacter formigenes HOxBLS]|uniref:Uncharacterized protein n=1 Tax=Oxalobacter paraformigenes TaxID=556268 RepID=T5LE74_9BURK|nr:hypothetical protein OFAG_02262 [Oxalobacter paraformigenes]
MKTFQHTEILSTMGQRKIGDICCDLIGGMMAGLIIFLPFLLYLFGFLKRSW